MWSTNSQRKMHFFLWGAGGNVWKVLLYSHWDRPSNICWMNNWCISCICNRPKIHCGSFSILSFPSSQNCIRIPSSWSDLIKIFFIISLGVWDFLCSAGRFEGGAVSFSSFRLGEGNFLVPAENTNLVIESKKQLTVFLFCYFKRER